MIRLECLIALAIFVGLVQMTVNHPPKIDLGFILDSSGQMTRQDYKDSLKLITSMLENFSISPGTTRVAFYTVSNQVSEIFRFKTFTNRDCTINSVRSIKFDGRNKAKNFTELVESALENILDGSKRKGITKKIALFITSSASDAVKIESTVMKEKSFAKELEPATVLKVIVLASKDALSRRSFDIPIMRYDGSEKDLRRIVRSTGEAPNSFGSCTTTGTTYDECGNRCRCRNGKLTGCRRVRKEVMTLTVEERKRYLRAYKELTSQSPYKEEYERFVFMHYKYFCWGIHGRELFLPWHRWFISKMEDMLRQIDCSVTLPYWDWSRVSNDPWNRTHLWRSTEDGLGGNGNMYRGYCVQKGIFREGAWETPYWEDPLDIILSTVDTVRGNISQQRPVLSFCLRRAFKGLTPSVLSIVRTMHLPPERFRDLDIQIRRNYHDRMHNTLGGTMSTHYAGNTPEFFMHHAMLDNIWYTWQQQSKRHLNAYFTNMTRRTMIGSPYTPSDYVNSHELPGCVAVTYDMLPTRLRHRRNVDDIDDMARKSYKYYVKIMKKGWFGKFPDCSRSTAEGERAKYLHETLDKP